jgi:hypothetical protein
VTVVSLCSTWYDNASPHRLSGALNIAETYKPYLKADRDNADVQQSIGALRNACMEFKPHTKEEFQQHALHIQHVNDPRLGRINYHYGNPDFMIMTRSLDPESNLRGGFVRIPPDVCKEGGYVLYDEEKAMALHMQHKQATEEYLKSKMPPPEEESMTLPLSGSVMEDDAVSMDVGEEEEISRAEWESSKFLNVREDQKIRSWFAVPWDHVLTWCFHTTDTQRASMGLRCKVLHVRETYTNPVTKRPDKRNKPYCWLVPDVQLRAVEQEYIRSWHDKIDVRQSLGDIGITIAPPLKHMGTLQGVSLKLRVNMYVIFWKPRNDAAQVAPKLLPTFPPFTQFVDDPFAELDMSKLKI